MKTGAQLVKKSLAEFRVRRRESSTIRFLPRHVRGRKHFARSERRIVRYRRTTEAQNAAKLSRKSGEATFSTVSKGAAFRSAFNVLSKHDPLAKGVAMCIENAHSGGIGRATATAACSLVFWYEVSFAQQQNPSGPAYAEPPPFSREA